MLVMRYAVVANLAEKTGIGMKLRLSFSMFMLLMISAVLLTAAGNIINDYFDRKVDIINRPDRVIIGKLVKRRVAIVLHQVFNAIALMLSVWVSYLTWYWWPVSIPVLVSTLLWWYSPVFKKRIFTGNLVVAVCTAAVPFWAVVYEIHELQKYYVDLLVNPQIFFTQLWQWTVVVMASAFVLTLVREAVKDIEDMKGDGEEQYKTLPIQYGVSFTKKYAVGLMLLFLAGIAYICYRVNIIAQLIPLLTVIVAVFLPSLACIISISGAQTKNDFRKAGIYLKWLMLGGLVALVVISYLG